MRIGIDGSCLSNRRGFGRFARQLVIALANAETEHEFVVFVDRPSSGQITLPKRIEQVVVDIARAPTAAATSSSRRRLRDMLAMGRATARAQLDLMFFPATYSFFPVWNVGKVVVVMHDALQYVYPNLVFGGRLARLSWRIKEAWAGTQADRIVTVSQTSQTLLHERGRWPKDRLRVITEGVDAVFRPVADEARACSLLEAYGIPVNEPFFLSVGGPSPHKNVPRLIEAFNRLGSRAVRLVLVGDMNDSFHSDAARIGGAIEASPARDRIVLAGYVPDEDLVHLYNKARALVFPSLMEGFGLPAVEAMACGTPVLASHAGSLPEVIGQAGEYFDPLNIDDMTACLARWLDQPELRQSLAPRALEQARLFTWDRAARLLLDCFEELPPPSNTAPRSSSIPTQNPAPADSICP